MQNLMQSVKVCNSPDILEVDPWVAKVYLSNGTEIATERLYTFKVTKQLKIYKMCHDASTHNII